MLMMRPPRPRKAMKLRKKVVAKKKVEAEMMVKIASSFSFWRLVPKGE